MLMGVSLVIVVIFVLTLLQFSTRASVYIVDNPTKEQVIQLTEADPMGRVWFEDANQLYQGSSLVKFVFKTRYHEVHRAGYFLDKVGVSYQLVKIEH